MGPEVALVLLGWAIAGGSPGPATLAISGTSMSQGRRAGFAMASGVIFGSATWGIAAALGVSAIMMANAWIFEVIRYLGATYLLYLAVRSLRNAAWQRPLAIRAAPRSRLFAKGLLIHLTNPKAILSWGSIYSIALPANAAVGQIWLLFAMLIATSMTVFWGYSFLFSSERVSNGYVRMRRWFDLAFGLLFGAASLKLLTARLT